MSSEKIEKLIGEELAKANEKHNPVFASNHEAYAVILEEFYESVEEIKLAKDCLDRIWSSVRKDESIKYDAERAMLHTFKAIEEMIQVGAMFRKAIMSENHRKIVEDAER